MTILHFNRPLGYKCLHFNKWVFTVNKKCKNCIPVFNAVEKEIIIKNKGVM